MSGLKIPMKLYKKAIRRGLRPEEEIAFGKLSAEEKQAFLGCFGKKSREAIPRWLSTDAEYILGGKGQDINSWIVMGRDRLDTRMSGHGGQCHTQAWSMDIVVGLMGHNVVNGGDTKYVNPNQRDDAARIYLSQKSDIDKHFGIENPTRTFYAPGASGVIKGQPDSEKKSAIAVKADAVRIIGRESIRIVTTGGPGDGQERKNSAGGDIASRMGIDLIAGNDYRELQPMVKGDTLIKSLKRLGDIISEANNLNYINVVAQTGLNLALMAHGHLHWAGNTTPDPLVIAAAQQTCKEHIHSVALGSVITTVNLSNWEINYLEPFGGHYILSRWNSVN